MTLVETKTTDKFTAEVYKANEYSMNLVFKSLSGDHIKTVENLPSLHECERYINQFSSSFGVLKG